MPNPTSAAPAARGAELADLAAELGELAAAGDSAAAVLGCALAYPQGAAEALADLHPADLHDPRHGAVLTALRRLLTAPTALAAGGAAGGPGVVDPVLVAASLARQDEVRCASWPMVVADLVRAACVPAAAPHHRRLILDALARRQALALATRLRQAATGADTDPARLQRLTQDGADALYATAARLHRAHATAGGTSGARRPLTPSREAA